MLAGITLIKMNIINIMKCLLTQQADGSILHDASALFLDMTLNCLEANPILRRLESNEITSAKLVFDESVKSADPYNKREENAKSARRCSGIRSAA